MAVARIKFQDPRSARLTADRLEEERPDLAKAVRELRAAADRRERRAELTAEEARGLAAVLLRLPLTVRPLVRRAMEELEEAEAEEGRRPRGPEAMPERLRTVTPPRHQPMMPRIPPPGEPLL